VLAVQHSSTDAVEYLAIDAAAGIYPAGDDISLTATWASPAVTGDPAIIYISTSIRRDYRVTRTTLDAQFRRKLTAIEYDADVYTLNVGSLAPLAEPEEWPGGPDQIPPALEASTIWQQAEIQASGVKRVVIASWRHPPHTWADKVFLFGRRQWSESWILLGDSREGVLEYDISGRLEAPAIWEFVVVPGTASGVMLAPSTATPTTINFSATPELLVSGEALQQTYSGSAEASKLYITEFPCVDGQQRFYRSGVMRPLTDADFEARHHGVMVSNPFDWELYHASYMFAGTLFGGSNTRTALGDIYEHYMIPAVDITGSQDTFTMPEIMATGTVLAWLDGVLVKPTDIAFANGNADIVFPANVAIGTHAVVRFIKASSAGDALEFLADAVTVDTFSADGSTFEFTCTVATTEGDLEAYGAGGILLPGSLDLDGVTFTFRQAPPAGWVALHHRSRF